MISMAFFALLPTFALQSSGLATPEPAFRRPSQAVPGDKAVKILFLRTRYADDDPSIVPYQPGPLELSAKKLNAFFRRQSYGLFSVGSYEISPLYRLAPKKVYAFVPQEPGAPPVERHKPMERDAIDAINLATNRRVGQVFDFICMMSRDPAVKHNSSQVAAKLSFYPHASTLTLFHELGHSLGFGHSNALVSEIPGETVPARDSRYLLEYGDHASAMGSVEIWAYGLVERYTMGWIGDSDRFLRYIKKLDWGENSFVSHDQASPRGLVGGYVEGRFGVEASEYKRDRTQRVHVTGSDEAVQRLWFSLLTSDGDDKGYVDLPRPFLLAQITGTVFAGRDGTLKQDHRTTVLLDLSPRGNDDRDMRPQSKGLFEGQSATIRQTDGSAVLVKFLRYDKGERRAVIDLSLIPKG